MSEVIVTGVAFHSTTVLSLHDHTGSTLLGSQSTSQSGGVWGAHNVSSPEVYDTTFFFTETNGNTNWRYKDSVNFMYMSAPSAAPSTAPSTTSSAAPTICPGARGCATCQTLRNGPSAGGW